MNAEPFSVSVSTDARVKMPEGYSSTAIERLVEATLHAERASGPWEVTIVFTDDDALRTLHREYLDDDTPTDIMTFPFATDGKWAGVGQVVHGGDIAISIERAATQRVDEGWDTLAEINFLVVHGVLHLLGWEDSSDTKRGAMLDRQRAILTSME